MVFSVRLYLMWLAEMCCVELDERAATHGFIGGNEETTGKSAETQKTEDVTRKSVKNDPGKCRHLAKRRPDLKKNQRDEGRIPSSSWCYRKKIKGRDLRVPEELEAQGKSYLTQNSTEECESAISFYEIQRGRGRSQKSKCGVTIMLCCTVLEERRTKLG